MKKIRQIGVRVFIYPLVMCGFFIAKNLIYDGLLIAKGNNIDVAVYVLSILVLCDVLSFFTLNKERKYWAAYLVYCIFLFFIFFVLRVVSVKVELTNILIIYGISLLTWSAGYLVTIKGK